MDINDYLLDQSGKEWVRLLRPWIPPLPTSFTLWLVNRFGDVFVVDDEGDGSVSMLDVGLGSFHKVANNREHFAKLIDEGDNAADWLLIPLIDECRAASMSCSPTQCYTFKLPPMLGGKYSVDNVATIEIDGHYAFAAEIYKSIKDKPNRTLVRKGLKIG